MSDFLKRLSRDPYAPIDAASVVKVDELGNGYDYRGELIAPKYTAPEQTWGETALGVATAPARIATALAGSLSPYGQDGWQVPPIINEGVDALTAVGDAYSGKMAPEDINSRALGMAGFMMGGGGLAARPAGGTGMFAGRLAKTADQEALARAERMAAEGADRRAIWDQTGWFQGPDQKWRFEIDDSGLRQRKFDDELRGLPPIASDMAWKHDDLFNAYPEVGDYPYYLSQEDKGGLFSRTNGEFNPVSKRITQYGESADKGNFLHEMQHGLQEYEGFSKGYNPNQAAMDIEQAKWKERDYRQKSERMQNAHSDEARVYLARASQGDAEAQAFVKQAQDKWFAKLGEKTDDNPFGVDLNEAVTFELTDTDPVFRSVSSTYQDAFKLSRMDPHELYKRHAGEVEARNVQKRMNMSADERRATPPWETQDIPDADQIVRLYSNASKEASAPAIAGALDMSTEARLARAREMGFNTDTVLYHGTGKDFQEFEPGTRGNGTRRAIYLTDNPDIADIYANSQNYGLRGGGDPMIYPLYAKAERPLVVSDKGPDGSFGWVSDNLASALGVDHPPAGKYATLYDEARRQGYDQVQIREMTDLGGPQTQYIPLKPEYIRSVNAAFDPAKSDSANLLAANADSRPALLGAGQEQDDGYADGGRVGFDPKYLVLHDYGGNPANRDGVFNPYHVLVFPDGSKRYRYPDDPYGRKAPHAFRLNPESVGISYAGDVGSQPTAAAMETLRNEAKAVAEMFPGIETMGHGEAFQATRGTNRQASRDGRDLEEASWRSSILYGPPSPGQTQVASAPVPMAKRGLTSFAGLEPSTAPVVRPLPSPAQSLAAAEMDAEPTPVAEDKPLSFDFTKLASLFAEPEPAQAPQVNFTPIQAFQSQGSPIQASTPYRGTFADGGQVRGLPDQSEPLHAGPLHSTVPGRTDHLPITVAAGSFVLPADIVSSLGEGNTNAGMETVSKMFPLPPVRRADGGRVPIAAAGGEYVIAPETVAALGDGDLETGHDLLDQFVRRTRAQNIQRLRALPGPEK